MNEKWLKQFIENYNGRSEEAKEVTDFIKENFSKKNPQCSILQLSEMFNVDRSTISKIKNGKRWNH